MVRVVFELFYLHRNLIFQNAILLILLAASEISLAQKLDSYDLCATITFENSPQLELVDEKVRLVCGDKPESGALNDA